MTPLLEREEQLALLRGAVERAVSGSGSLLLIGGEAGIGKSSLVRELRAALPASVAFLLGACEPLSVPVPLGPLREIAEAAGGRDPAEAGTSDPLALARTVMDAIDARAPPPPRSP